VANSFDRRVVSEPALSLMRALQQRVRCHLGGGAALSGVHLHHRRSRDLDLFCHEAQGVRELVGVLGEAAREAGVTARLVRDAGTFVRASVDLGEQSIELDLVYESTGDLSVPSVVDGVLVESLNDLRAAKLMCILSRLEPRDLVDLLFLDRAGYPPELDLALALQKDAGIDPSILAWLLGQYPTRPLPDMLVPLSEEELRRFRDDLRDRFKRGSVP
jgi:hypothetical protein